MTAWWNDPTSSEYQRMTAQGWSIGTPSPATPSIPTAATTGPNLITGATQTATQALTNPRDFTRRVAEWTKYGVPQAVAEEFMRNQDIINDYNVGQYSTNPVGERGGGSDGQSPSPLSSDERDLLATYGFLDDTWSRGDGGIWERNMGTEDKPGTLPYTSSYDASQFQAATDANAKIASQYANYFPQDNDVLKYVGIIGAMAAPFAIGGLGGLGGEIGADALAGGLAGDTLGGAALDYSMTGTLGGGLGTAAGTSAGAGAALSALEPFSLATAAGAGGGLAAGAGTLSNALSPFSLGSTSLPTPPTGGGGTSGYPLPEGVSGPPSPLPPGSTETVGRLGTSFIPGIPNNVLSGIGQGIFGPLGANAQSSALEDTTNQWLNVSAPFRNQLLAMLQPNSPAVQQMVSDVAKQLGPQYGNVGFSPSALGDIATQVGNRMLIPGLSAGAGLGLNTAGNASLAQAGSAGGIYDALAAGVRTATAPTLEDLIGQMNNLGLTVGGSRV